MFLIDHAWTYEAEFARAQLRSIPGLAKRMASLMDLLEESEESVNGDTACQNGNEKETCPGESPKICSSDGFYTNEHGNVFLYVIFGPIKRHHDNLRSTIYF